MKTVLELPKCRVRLLASQFNLNHNKRPSPIGDEEIDLLLVPVFNKIEGEGSKAKFIPG
jgi:hypothetical protein